MNFGNPLFWQMLGNFNPRDTDYSELTLEEALDSGDFLDDLRSDLPALLE